MDTATQAQLALLKRLLDQGRLTEAEYQAEVAALGNSATTFDPCTQAPHHPSHVGTSIGEAHQPGVAVGTGVPVGSREKPGSLCHPVCCAVHAPRPAQMP